MSEVRDELVERIAELLRTDAESGLDAKVDRRIMATVRALPRHRPEGEVPAWWRWLREPREVRIAPLWGLAAAAAIAVVLLAPWRGRPAAALPATDSLAVEFVLVAPGAGTVTLVGDFNDWNVSATPMQPRGGEEGRGNRGVWSADLRLPAGRYRYAFVVDGRRWMRDPTAPMDAGDDFGTPSSVITVGGAL